MQPTSINPHLGFNGNCAEAFAFYAGLFGGEITFMMKYGDSPEKDKMPPEVAALSDHVMHATIKIGNFHIMGGDAPAADVRQGGRLLHQPAVPRSGRRRTRLPRLARRRQRRHALGRDLLVQGLRHVHRPLRPALDGQFRRHHLMTAAVKPEALSLNLTRTFDAPRDLVWAAFTHPEMLIAWWGARAPPGDRHRHGRPGWRAMAQLPAIARRQGHSVAERRLHRGHPRLSASFSPLPGRKTANAARPIR
ncbi:MAG: hypothetical protein WDN06_05925 [Asticcacaulis sp.]